MKVIYYGADNHYKNIIKKGFTRRNTNILKALANNKEVEQLFVVNQVPRLIFLRNFLKCFFTKKKVTDVYITDFLSVGKFSNKRLNGYLNKGYLKIIFLVKNVKNIFAWVYLPNGYIQYKNYGIKSTLIFDADHNIVEDLNNKKEDNEHSEKLITEIINESKVNISGSDSMIDWFNKMGGRNNIKMRNGIDSSRFSFNILEEESINAVFCGVISTWVDFTLFLKLVQANKCVHFYIAGKVYVDNEQFSLIKEQKNVTYLGSIEYNEIPSLFAKCQIGICVYNKGLDGDSMKLYEYLSSNLLVFSTKFHENLGADFNGLINFIDENNLDLLAKYKAVYNLNNLDLNKENLSNFLNNSSWDMRVSALIKSMKHML